MEYVKNLEEQVRELKNQLVALREHMTVSDLDLQKAELDLLLELVTGRFITLRQTGQPLESVTELMAKLARALQEHDHE